jgi:hypothetical protein
MIDLDLSEEDIDSLLQFAIIEDNQKELVISVINNYQKSQPHKIIIQEISDKLNIDFDSVETFINAYISLVRTKWSYNLTNEELLTSLSGNIALITEYDEKVIDVIKNWVIQLLDIPNKDTLISSLAYNAVYSNSNIYYYSEIFEELRPVFLNDDLAGLASYHTIKLHYETPNKKHTNIYLVLDDSDVDSLIVLLNKAKVKAESVKAHYQKDIINI